MYREKNLYVFTVAQSMNFCIPPQLFCEESDKNAHINVIITLEQIIEKLSLCMRAILIIYGLHEYIVTFQNLVFYMYTYCRSIIQNKQSLQVTCSQSEKSDVMMDKSKYLYEFVKLRVVNVRHSVYLLSVHEPLDHCATARSRR